MVAKADVGWMFVVEEKALESRCWPGVLFMSQTPDIQSRHIPG